MSLQILSQVKSEVFTLKRLFQNGVNQSLFRDVKLVGQLCVSVNNFTLQLKGSTDLSLLRGSFISSNFHYLQVSGQDFD